MTRPDISKIDAGGGTRLLRAAFLPLLLGLGFGVLYAFGLDQFLTFDALTSNREWLLHQVTEHFAVSALIFMALYVAATALSVPGSFILTIAAGFLFGRVWGTCIAVVAATTGATVIFLIASTSLGALFRERSEGKLAALKNGFRRNELSYLLFLRLIPLFPFWLINLACAFLGVSLRTFVLGTMLGIIPGTAVYASIGSGLGAILDRGQKPSLDVILLPSILIPLVVLAVLSLAPIVYRSLRTSKERPANVR
jgi:uncharacterized membrane protein YdjX (TVP38/TMEM64 family)